MKSKFSMRKLFSNSKFVLVLSVLISVTIWVNMSLSSDNHATATIANIPIDVTLSEEAENNGLHIFSGLDQSASVTVDGNRVALGSINTSDIIISAPTAGTITSSGTYPLSLTARKLNPNDNFEIISPVSPSVITVFVDYMRKSNFEVENKVNYSVAEGYHADVTLSYSKIKVEGPQTEISKIASVGIEGTIGGTLKEDTELECDVKLYDVNGAELTDNFFTLSHDKITVAFSVNPVKEVPVKLDFENKPSELDIDSLISISPSSVMISGPEDVLNKTEYVKTEPIDFLSLDNKEINRDLDIVLPDNCINLNDNNTASVEIDLSSFETKKVNTSNLVVSGLNNGFTSQITTDSIEVKLKGSKYELQKINGNNVVCVIDASNIEEITGSISLPVKVKINGSKSCWAYGEYKANVIVTRI